MKRSELEQISWKMMKKSTGHQIIWQDIALWFVVGICCGMILMATANGAPIEYQFKSPSFNGVNQSSHYLTIENQETSRKEALQQEIDDLQDQIERDAKNTTLAKFIRNVESRIYSTLSRQIVDEMFGENPSDSGSFDIEGTGIQYVKDGGNVELTITDEDGSTTVITVPIGDFGI